MLKKQSRSQFALFLFSVLFSSSSLVSSPTYSRQVESWLSRMTLQEKIDLLGGTGFATKGFPHLGIPAVEMIDGPIGVRFGQATAWPSGLALAATFSPTLIEQMGAALAKEVRSHNKNMILGPTINIARTPWGGRTFESYGEDPYLAGKIAAAYIQGVEAAGVTTCTKHFALNNQEWRRMDIDVLAHERMLYEIYFPAFETAIQAGTSCIMAAYNKVNGHYASENSYLIKDIIKGKMEFQGPVVSDWGATHSTIPAALAGLDLEMPTGVFFDQRLHDAVMAGQVPAAEIDDKARRLLWLAEKTLSTSDHPSISQSPLTTHKELAKRLAIQGSVLLKNNQHILPLNTHKPLKLGLVGPSLQSIRAGGGSSRVNHTQAPSPEARIREFLKQKNSPVEIQSSVGTRIPGDKVTTSEGLFYSKSKEGLTVPGFSAEYYANPNLVGTPSFTRTDFVINFDWEWSSPDYAFLPDEYFSVRWKSTFIPRSSGLHRLVLAGDDGVRLKIDGQIVVDKWTPLFLAPPFQESSLDLEFVANQTYQIEVEYVERDTLSAVHFDVIEPQDLKLLDQSERIAKESDIVVLFVGTSEKTESEGYDREGLYLPGDQEDLIKKVTSLNSNVIIVVQAGSPITMPWVNQVQAVLYTWFPGSEGGDAMASMLFGESEPEGRLPISFPKRIEDSSAYASYPKTIDQDNGRLAYDDGIFVGYRHFDHYQIEPLFPFGFGLSYTKFDSLFGYLKITNDHHQDPQVNGTISSTNIGDRSGSEVLYVFVSKINSNVSRAKKELKFFKKFSLAPKETAQTDFSLKFRDFAYYDENEKAWVVEPGMYQIMLARSANEVLEVKAIELK